VKRGEVVSDNWGRQGVLGWRKEVVISEMEESSETHSGRALSFKVLTSK
jgi:hypothetical protein